MPAATVTMPEALKAKSLYEQGYSMPQIEPHVKRTRKQIRTALRQLGVSVRSRSEAQQARDAQAKDSPAKPRGFAALPPERRKELARMGNRASRGLRPSLRVEQPARLVE